MNLNSLGLLTFSVWMVSLNIEGVSEDEFEFVGVVDLLGLDGEFEHLDSSLLGKHADISAILGIVSTLGFEVQSSEDVGVNGEAASNNVVGSDVDGFSLDVPSLEEVGGNEVEDVWFAGGVSFEVNSVSTVLLQVDIDLELGSKLVSVLFVDKDVDLIVSVVESSIRISRAEESVDS